MKRNRFKEQQIISILKEADFGVKFAEIFLNCSLHLSQSPIRFGTTFLPECSIFAFAISEVAEGASKQDANDTKIYRRT